MDEGLNAENTDPGATFLYEPCVPEDMAKIAVSQEKLDKVLSDVQTLIEDVSSMLDQDAVAKRRLAQVRKDPSIGRSEADLDQYLKKRDLD